MIHHLHIHSHHHQHPFHCHLRLISPQQPFTHHQQQPTTHHPQQPTTHHPQQPTTHHLQQPTTHNNLPPTTRYFTLFMNLLNDCSEDIVEDTKRPNETRGVKINCTNTLRNCTVLAMSNLLNANIDSGLMHSIGECSRVMTCHSVSCRVMAVMPCQGGFGCHGRFWMIYGGFFSLLIFFWG